MGAASILMAGLTPGCHSIMVCLTAAAERAEAGLKQHVHACDVAYKEQEPARGRHVCSGGGGGGRRGGQYSKQNEALQQCHSMIGTSAAVEVLMHGWVCAALAGLCAASQGGVGAAPAEVGCVHKPQRLDQQAGDTDSVWPPDHPPCLHTTRCTPTTRPASDISRQLPFSIQPFSHSCPQTTPHPAPHFSPLTSA